MIHTPQTDDLQIVISRDAGFADAGGPLLAKAKEAFEALGKSLRDSLSPLKNQLKQAELAPDEIELSLELVLKGGSNWVVVSGSGEATVGVKLLWKR